jgi:hypothetical protein
MIHLPTSRAQLVGAPLTGAALGALAALFLWPLIGAHMALGLGAAVGLLMGTCWGRSAYLSDFGPRQWLVGAWSAALCLSIGVAGIAAGVLVVGGTHSLAFSVLLTGCATVVVTAAVAGWREFLALRAEGTRGPWWTQTVDLERRMVGDPMGTHVQHGGGSAAVWLAAPLAVNIPLILQSMGYREAEWMPFVLAALSATVLWVSWKWVGPLGARAIYMIRVEAGLGQPLVHHDIAALRALRLRSPASGSPLLARQGIAVRLKRALHLALQIVAGLGIVGGLTLVFMEAWPELDRSLRWEGYQRAELTLTRLELGTSRAQWMGGGEVDGYPVRFGRGELDAVLGPPPSSAKSAAFQQAKSRLPMRMTVLWNGQAQRRLLATDARREVFDIKAHNAVGICAGLLGVGALAAALASAMTRAEARIKPPRKAKHRRPSEPRR